MPEGVGPATLQSRLIKPSQARGHGERALSSLVPVTTDQERDSVAQELLRLSLPELVDVLRRVLPAHATHDDLTASTLVLAEVSRVLLEEDPGFSEPPYIEVVAWPDRDHYNGGFGPEPANYESGSCPSCSLEVASTAKQALCPLCGTLCELT